LAVDPHLGITVLRTTKILYGLKSPVGFNLRSSPFYFGHPCNTSRIDQPGPALATLTTGIDAMSPASEKERSS
jgi:hypothetical protein